MTVCQFPKPALHPTCITPTNPLGACSCRPACSTRPPLSTAAAKNPSLSPSLSRLGSSVGLCCSSYSMQATRTCNLQARALPVLLPRRPCICAVPAQQCAVPAARQRPAQHRRVAAAVAAPARETDRYDQPACLLGCCTSVHADSRKALEHGILQDANWHHEAAVQQTLQPVSLSSLNPACTQRMVASSDHVSTCHCHAQPCTSQQHAACDA